MAGYQPSQRADIPGSWRMPTISALLTSSSPPPNASIDELKRLLNEKNELCNVLQSEIDRLRSIDHTQIIARLRSLEAVFRQAQDGEPITVKAPVLAEMQMALDERAKEGVLRARRAQIARTAVPATEGGLTYADVLETEQQQRPGDAAYEDGEKNPMGKYVGHIDAGYHQDEDGYFKLANGPRDLKPNRLRPQIRRVNAHPLERDLKEETYGSALSAPVEHLDMPGDAQPDVPFLEMYVPDHSDPAQYVDRQHLLN